MLIALHKNARTTPAVRAEIAASHETASVLAQRFGITEQTVYTLLLPLDACWGNPAKPRWRPGRSRPVMASCAP
jgi:hypothetical protein